MKKVKKFSKQDVMIVKNKKYFVTSKPIVNNKFIMFKKLKVPIFKEGLDSINKTSVLRSIFLSRLKVLSKTLFFLKKYFKFKKNEPKKSINKEIFEDDFNFFRMYLKLSFYRIWTLRYKFLRVFVRKTKKRIWAESKFRSKKKRLKSRKPENYLFKNFIIKKFRKRKKIRKFLYKKENFMKYYIFKQRAFYKHSFKVKKFFKRHSLKFRKKFKNSKIQKLNFLLKNNLFIKRVLYKNIIELKNNQILRKRLKVPKLLRKFIIRKKRKRQYEKKKLEIKEKRKIFAKRFKKSCEFMRQKLLFYKNRMNVKNFFKSGNIEEKFTRKPINLKKLNYKQLNLLKSFHYTIKYKKNNGKSINFVNKRLNHLNLERKSGLIEGKNSKAIENEKFTLDGRSIKKVISRWKLKKRFVKVFKVAHRKLNIYFSIQKAFCSKIKSVSFKNAINAVKNDLFLNKRFLNKIFKLIRVYKNMIFLKKKKLLGSKFEARAFKRYNYFCKLFKTIKAKNSKLILNLKKKIISRSVSKFRKKKSSVLKFKKKSLNKVKLKVLQVKKLKKNLKKKIISRSVSKDFLKFRKKKSSVLKFKKKSLNKVKLKVLQVKKLKKNLKKKVRPISYAEHLENICVNKKLLYRSSLIKNNRFSYFFKIPALFNIKFFINKLFLKFNRGGNKSFSKKILFYFFTFLKKKYYINMNMYGWLKAYMIQVFLKLVPIFGYMFIKYKRDFLKVPKVFRYARRSSKNGVSISISWIKKSLLKRAEKTLFLKLISELESIRTNKSESIKFKKDYYFEIKNNFRKVWKRLRLVR